MKSEAIYFLMNASSTIGMGHFNRCLAVSEILLDVAKPVFIMGETLPTCQQSCKDRGIELIIGSKQEIQDQIPMDSWVITDDYTFTTEIQQIYKSKGCKLICIDDIHQFDFVADLVINHGTTDERVYSTASYTKLLLGPKYAILKQDFLADRVVKQPKTSLHKILISLGGTDPGGFTKQVMLHLEALHVAFEYHILTTSGNVHLSDILHLANSNTSVKVHMDLSASEVKLLMDGVDLAILPASTVSYEACSVGVGLMVGISADNQVDIYQTLLKNDLAVGLGSFKELGDRSMRNFMEGLTMGVINNQIAHQREIFDGKSMTRIKDEIIKILH